MTIWILAFVLIGLMVAIGYSIGAIRMAVAFIGVIFSLLLANLAGKLFTPLLGAFGVVNPVLLWAIPPLCGYVLVSIIFEVIGIAVHRKVDVYYKYKAGDLRLALWERINTRLGAAMGVLNGTAYAVVASFVIYAISYCTVQVASSDTDPRSMRFVNALGRDLESTKMVKVARALDSLDPAFYETADIAGLVYTHPLLEARLWRYPGLLSLSEKPEFLELASDNNFTAMRLKNAPIQEVLDNPRAQAVFNNVELLRTLWQTLKPDLTDLGNYLTNGVSGKYEDHILGRWAFDSSGTVNAYRRAKPNVSASDAQKIEAFMKARFGQVAMVIAPDHSVVLKNMPQGAPTAQTPASTKNLKGTWSEAGTSNYEFKLDDSANARNAKFEGSRLVVTVDAATIVFSKVD